MENTPPKFVFLATTVASSTFPFGIVIFVIALAFVVIAMTKLTKKGTGFLSVKETCAICGKEIGLNRYKIGKTIDGNIIWKCPACTKKGGLLQVDYATGKARLVDVKDTEVRKKCNVCGHLYCYNFNDLETNRKNANQALMDSVSAFGHAVGGSSTASAVNLSNARNSLGGIVDYNKCPHCGSLDVKELTVDEWNTEQAKAKAPAVPAVSPADELKKFKELLDLGVISQEEFDAKKKQLLGL